MNMKLVQRAVSLPYGRGGSLQLERSRMLEVHRGLLIEEAGCEDVRRYGSEFVCEVYGGWPSGDGASQAENGHLKGDMGKRSEGTEMNCLGRCRYSESAKTRKRDHIASV